MSRTHDAQLVSNDSSFAAVRASHELGVLRHPAKPRLRAVLMYEVLPDADIWANAYNLFRSSERPGERGPEVRSLFASPLCYSLCLFLGAAGRS